MPTDIELAEVRALCPEANAIADAGQGFISLPGLRVVSGGTIYHRDALLTLQEHSGYASRLLLSEAIPGKQGNWSQQTALGRTWHTLSWGPVPPRRPIEMLRDHLRAYE